MDDFIYVLSAGLIVLVFAFILSGLGPWISPGDYQTSVINFTVGNAGVMSDAPTRTDSFESFVVGEVQSYELKAIPQFMVGTSWLGANLQKYNIIVPEWYLEDIRSIRITFNVYDTNKYGNLVLKWNGLEVEKEVLGKGRQEIIIEPEVVKGSNNLEVYAEGPGLFFWASTVYVLRDFTVNVEYGPKKIIPFQILGSELEAFSKGEIEFYATDTTSELTIKVNGVEIFDEVPRGPEKAEFDYVDVPLKAGTNILSLSTEGYVNLHDVDLNLYLLTNEAVRVRRFTVTDEQYGLFDYGYKLIVNFDVEEIAREGSLNVRLNDKTVRVGSVDEGMNSVIFDKDEVIKGENEIGFSGTGGYVIGEASIGIGI